MSIEMNIVRYLLFGTRHYMSLALSSTALNNPSYDDNTGQDMV